MWLFSGEQLENAAIIMQAGADMDLSGRDQQIAIMTAIGESTLMSLDHGDEAGPDSRGLFQQRDNGAWGTYEDRMDPYTSATMFYEVLATVDDRDSMEPTYVAHEVQANAVPTHYAPFWPDAQEIVAALADGSVEFVETVVTAPAGECPVDVSYIGEISADGWAAPTATMLVTSAWGMRADPQTGECRMHDGLDLDGHEGDPYFAAADGVVTDIYYNSGGGWIVDVELEDGTGMLRHLHTHASDNSEAGTPEVSVAVGDAVTPGHHLGNIGNTGRSFGAHLHWEILDSNGSVDPEAVMIDQGFEFQYTGSERSLHTCGDPQ